jgi:ParB/RepB/Spo0J family partition protein
MELELNLLSLGFSHLRITQAVAVNKLMNSIQQFGQQVPVIIIKESQQASCPWLLVDGYLRYAALKQLKIETIHTQVWECDKQQALLQLLFHHQSRQWLPFEESLLLKTLQEKGLSQHELAALVGKRQAWVSHRLAMTQFLSESLQTAILRGVIPTWTALRILLPIARAIPEHAEKLEGYLSTHSHSTRELQRFYAHYQKCCKAKKNQIIDDLELFFKSQTFLEQERAAKKLKEGPEGEWNSMLNHICVLIKKVENLVPHVFYVNQLPNEKECALNVFERVESYFSDLSNTIGAHINDH